MNEAVHAEKYTQPQILESVSVCHASRDACAYQEMTFAKCSPSELSIF
jgi:hypothetical protein